MSHAPGTRVTFEIAGPNSQQGMMHHQRQTVLQQFASCLNRTAVARTCDVAIGEALDALQIVGREKDNGNSYKCGEHGSHEDDSALSFDAELPNADCHCNNDRK